MQSNPPVFYDMQKQSEITAQEMGALEKCSATASRESWEQLIGSVAEQRLRETSYKAKASI
jgi:hypothetical protein